MAQSIDITQTIDLLKQLISIPSTSREEGKVLVIREDSKL